MFARHSNPWSAWTRWASTPLFLVPFWTKQACHAIPLAAWAVLNPVVYPKPATNDAWATRAILGEELWMAASPRDRTALVGLLATACGAGAALALLLVSWQLMSQYYDEHSLGRRSLPATGEQ